MQCCHEADPATFLPPRGNNHRFTPQRSHSSGQLWRKRLLKGVWVGGEETMWRITGHTVAGTGTWEHVCVRVRARARKSPVSKRLESFRVASQSEVQALLSVCSVYVTLVKPNVDLLTLLNDSSAPDPTTPPLSASLSCLTHSASRLPSTL